MGWDGMSNRALDRPLGGLRLVMVIPNVNFYFYARDAMMRT
jgi:hypothetical protein